MKYLSESIAAVLIVVALCLTAVKCSKLERDVRSKCLEGHSPLECRAGLKGTGAF